MSQRARESKHKKRPAPSPSRPSFGRMITTPASPINHPPTSKKHRRSKPMPTHPSVEMSPYLVQQLPFTKVEETSCTNRRRRNSGLFRMANTPNLSPITALVRSPSRKTATIKTGRCDRDLSTNIKTVLLSPGRNYRAIHFREFETPRKILLERRGASILSFSSDHEVEDEWKQEENYFVKPSRKKNKNANSKKKLCVKPLGSVSHSKDKKLKPAWPSTARQLH